MKKTCLSMQQIALHCLSLSACRVIFLCVTKDTNLQYVPLFTKEQAFSTAAPIRQVSTKSRLAKPGRYVAHAVVNRIYAVRHLEYYMNCGSRIFPNYYGGPRLRILITSISF